MKNQLSTILVFSTKSDVNLKDVLKATSQRFAGLSFTIVVENGLSFEAEQPDIFNEIDFTDVVSFYKGMLGVADRDGAQVLRAIDNHGNLSPSLCKYFASESRIKETCFLDGAEISFDFSIQKISHQLLQDAAKMNPMFLPNGMLYGGESYITHKNRVLIQNEHRAKYLGQLARNGPWSIALDVTRRCNLACKKCLYNSPLIETAQNTLWKESPLDLDWESAKKAIDTSPPSSTIVIGNSGEATVYPHFSQLIEYIGSKGRNFHLNTNMVLMDEAMLHRCLENGMRSITISMDATNEDTHNKLVPGKHFAKIVENMERIISATNLQVSVVFVSIPGINTDELEDFLAKHLDRVDSVIVNQYRDVNSRELQKPNRKTYSNGLACLEPYVSLMVMTDGLVTPGCCIEDYDGLNALSLGNIKEQGLEDIWQSDKLHELRSSLLSNSPTNSTCMTCKNATHLCRDISMKDSRVQETSELATYYRSIN